MSGLTPFDRNLYGARPFSSDDFYNTLDNFFTDPWMSGKNTAFKVDVEEKEDEYLIEAELPGIKKEEINIQLLDNRLSIAVNKQEEVDNRNKNYIHKERRYSSMQRAVVLPGACYDNISAKLENGVLNVHVPKDRNMNRSRRIDIQ